MKLKVVAAALAAVIGLGTVAMTAAPAQARSEDTWRALTYGLGGLTAYGAVKRSPTIALLGAAGTYYAYTRWKKSVRDRHRGYRYRVRGYRGYYPASYSGYRGYRSYRTASYYPRYGYRSYRYAPVRVVNVYRVHRRPRHYHYRKVVRVVDVYR
jgi:hypothetical protein